MNYTQLAFVADSTISRAISIFLGLLKSVGSDMLVFTLESNYIHNRVFVIVDDFGVRISSRILTRNARLPLNCYFSTIIGQILKSLPTVVGTIRFCTIHQCKRLSTMSSVSDKKASG